MTKLSERLELARDAGEKRILVPCQNKRDIADIPDEILDARDAFGIGAPSRWTCRIMPVSEIV